MQSVYLFVDEEPYLYHGENVDMENLEYIESINYNYFEKTSRIIYKEFKRKKDKDFAISIRLLHSHCSEHFFSILFASMQGYDAINVWLLLYTPKDLRELIRKTQSEIPFFRKFPDVKPNWESILNKIHFGLDFFNSFSKEVILKTVIELADRFNSETYFLEYNSIKHSLRNKFGSFQIEIGPLENKVKINGGDYGSTFRKIERLSKNNKYHLSTSKIFSQWNPDRLFSEIQILSLLISNIKSFLIAINCKEPHKIEFKLPKTEFLKDYQNLPEPELISGKLERWSISPNYKLIDKNELLKIIQEKFPGLFKQEYDI